MILTKLLNELSKKEIMEKIDHNLIYFPDDFPLNFLRIREIFNYYDERNKEFPLVLKKINRLEIIGYSEASVDICTCDLKTDKMVGGSFRKIKYDGKRVNQQRNTRLHKYSQYIQRI